MPKKYALPKDKQVFKWISKKKKNGNIFEKNMKKKNLKVSQALDRNKKQIKTEKY